MFSSKYLEIFREFINISKNDLTFSVSQTFNLEHLISSIRLKTLT